MADFFTLSLRSDISLTLEGDLLTLQSAAHYLTLEHPQPGLRSALEHLKHSAQTAAQLTDLILEVDGMEDALTFEAELQKLINLGWICHSVLPFATAIPIAENYSFITPDFDWQQPFTLSRFAFLYQNEQQLILESPLSKSKVVALDWRVVALIAKLVQSQAITLDALAEVPLPPEAIQSLLALLMAAEMIAVGQEDPSLAQWQFHNLLFHRQTRLERLDDTHKFNLPYFKERDRYPIVKPPMSDQSIPLVKPDLTALTKNDMSLTQAIESRQSIREYADRPISQAQLAEFLYRCARVKEVYTREDDPMGIGECTKRPYPTGGAIYELEIYPVINRCEELDSGLYHYQPLSHTLHQISGWHSEVEALIYDAWKSSGQQDIPQVLLIITARFGRLFWKYPVIGYGLILKHIGVLYQTFYLVATAMQLAPCAIGAGNSEQFGKIVNLNAYEEASVGEFMLGSLKPALK
jgi:oxazoline/thiazoline dehydrogenase